VGLHLLRIAQEALTNAFRHARARRVWLRVTYGPGTLQLSVRDDGQGFDPQLLQEGGFGLVSMRERSEHIGGRLQIDTRPGAGTEVTLTLAVAAE
jgi:signal transduction histidine kinase